MARKLILAALLLTTVSALASPFTFPFTLVSFNGPFVNGIPTYPYTLRIGLFTIPGMCDDYYHDGTPGDHWTAYLNNIPAANLNYMRFGRQGIIPYEEASWLLLETFSQPRSQWPDMNFAVWHIFNPAVPINSNAQFWINQAIINYKSGNYSTVWVATPLQIDAPSTGDQEFLIILGGSGPPNPPPEPVPSPEPTTLALTGGGILAWAAALRTRLK